MIIASMVILAMFWCAPFFNLMSQDFFSNSYNRVKIRKNENVGLNLFGFCWSHRNWRGLNPRNASWIQSAAQHYIISNTLWKLDVTYCCIHSWDEIILFKVNMRLVFALGFSSKNSDVCLFTWDIRLHMTLGF